MLRLVFGGRNAAFTLDGTPSNAYRALSKTSNERVKEARIPGANLAVSVKFAMAGCGDVLNRSQTISSLGTEQNSKRSSQGMQRQALEGLGRAESLGGHQCFTPLTFPTLDRRWHD